MADDQLFDSWTHDYALLGLRMDRVYPGTVDGWIGPPEWREMVLAEEIPEPRRLLRDAVSLEERLPNMGYEARREAYLARQIAALRTQAELATGAELPFAEQARRFFDIEPQRQPESNFEAAHAQLEEILPGSGPLLDRLTAWRESLELSGERVLRALEPAAEEARKRTLARIALPPEERVDIELVSDKPWGAYNWYLGRYRSLIEVNTDEPRPVTFAPDYMAHEGYPGHHVEHVLREREQYLGQGQGECAIMLINTPESVISEAIATCAREAIFPGDEDLEWLASITGDLGLELDVAMARQLRAATQGLEGVGTNAAFLLHEEGRPAEEVAQYVSRWDLIPLERARKFLEFTQDPLWRVYPFTYRNGRALLRPLLQGPDRLDVLQRICTEPVYPSLLAQWDAA
jgi:hypothetical protein